MAPLQGDHERGFSARLGPLVRTILLAGGLSLLA